MKTITYNNPAVGCYVDGSSDSADNCNLRTIPDEDFCGEWLHISDHGNATLYFRDSKGEDKEVWSVI